MTQPYTDNYGYDQINVNPYDFSILNNSLYGSIHDNKMKERKTVSRMEKQRDNHRGEYNDDKPDFYTGRGMKKSNRRLNKRRNIERYYDEDSDDGSDDEPVSPKTRRHMAIFGNRYLEDDSNDESYNLLKNNTATKYIKKKDVEQFHDNKDRSIIDVYKMEIDKLTNTNNMLMLMILVLCVFIMYSFNIKSSLSSGMYPYGDIQHSMRSTNVHPASISN